MKINGRSDDNSTFWRHVLTRDHPFVIILLVHGCKREYLRYSAPLMMGQGGATEDVAKMKRKGIQIERTSKC
jgi:hypothetical protein